MHIRQIQNPAPPPPKPKRVAGYAHVSKLKKALGAQAAHIKTITGFGYKMEGE